MADFRKRTEEWFGSIARILYRNRFKTLLITFLTIAAIVSQIPKISIDISTEGFLHESDPTLIDYNAFRDQFGRDELIIVAVKSSEVFDKDFLHKLKDLHDELTENVPYIEDITSLINARSTRGKEDEIIVGELMENWPETPEEITIIKQWVFDNPLYKNTLISEDGKFTTILIKTQTYSSIGSNIEVLEGFEEDFKQDSKGPKEPGKSNERQFLTDKENSEAVNTVSEIVEKYEAPGFKVYIAGSSAVTHFLKKSMIKDMQRFLYLPLSLSLYFFLSCLEESQVWFCRF